MRPAWGPYSTDTPFIVVESAVGLLRLDDAEHIADIVGDEEDLAVRVLHDANVLLVKLKGRKLHIRVPTADAFCGMDRFLTPHA